MRSIRDERQLLTELGRLFHTVRANHKERRNVERSLAARTAASAGKARRKGAKRSRRRRRCAGGGSVWILLKGGFSSAAVPAEEDRRRVDAKCFARGATAERKRLAALQAAEAYVESAWTAAEQVGIVEREGASGGRATCDEGVVYMREQYTVAVQTLNNAQTRAPGACLKRIVEESVGGAASALASCTPAENAEITAFREARTGSPTGGVDWEAVAAREQAIRQNVFTAPLRSDACEGFYYRLAEPASPSGRPDIAATKCIVRVRNSQRQKHTSILAAPRAINHFKSNFMQLLRKELNNSGLPRGNTAADDEAAAAAAAAASSSAGRGDSRSSKQQQQQQRQGGGGKSKRRGNR